MSRPVSRRTVTVPVEYQIHPHHRNRTPGKSQWTITELAEVGAFEVARGRNWLTLGTGWGLHVRDGRAEYLGIAADQATLLFLAKYVDTGRTNQWHGYPVPNDAGGNKPPDQIIGDWMSMELIRPACARKLAQGRPCNL
jgi:hypothetical protein